METNTNAPAAPAALVVIGVSRGKRLHLGEVNGMQTLCGIAHRTNPRYVTATRFSMPLEYADCPKCIAARA